MVRKKWAVNVTTHNEKWAVTHEFWPVSDRWPALFSSPALITPLIPLVHRPMISGKNFSSYVGFCRISKCNSRNTNPESCAKITIPVPEHTVLGSPMSAIFLQGISPKAHLIWKILELFNMSYEKVKANQHGFLQIDILHNGIMISSKR